MSLRSERRKDAVVQSRIDSRYLATAAEWLWEKEHRFPSMSALARHMMEGFVDYILKEGARPVLTSHQAQEIIELRVFGESNPFEQKAKSNEEREKHAQFSNFLQDSREPIDPVREALVSRDTPENKAMADEMLKETFHLNVRRLQAAGAFNTSTEHPEQATELQSDERTERERKRIEELQWLKEQQEERAARRTGNEEPQEEPKRILTPSEQQELREFSLALRKATKDMNDPLLSSALRREALLEHTALMEQLKDYKERGMGDF